MSDESKVPGMAVQALAGEIIEALLADEKDGGYDLTAGMFGPEFSKLVRRWAQAEWERGQQLAARVPIASVEMIDAAMVEMSNIYPPAQAQRMRTADFRCALSSTSTACRARVRHKDNGVLLTSPVPGYIYIGA